MEIICQNCGISTVVEMDLGSVQCTSCGSTIDVPTTTHIAGAFEESDDLAIHSRLATHSGAAKIGKYSVVCVAQQGGFGIVYKALDEALDRYVALKVPRPDRVDARSTQNYLREARSAARLKHPNIVTVYDAGEHEGGVYIAMEWIDGQSLAGWAAEEKPTWQEVCRVMAPVADAIHFAHKKGFVHRDIKPGNILLDREGRVYVADFGLAIHEDGQLKLKGQIAGTGPYMSPEQFRGEVDSIDGRTDIWSFGVTLYCLLTGRRPFCSEGKFIVEHALEKPPKPLRQINEAIPQQLEELVLSCLEKDPANRISTAHDVARRLSEIGGGERKRHWPLTAGAALAAVVLIGLSFYAFAGRNAGVAAGIVGGDTPGVVSAGGGPDEIEGQPVEKETPDKKDPTRGQPRKIYWPDKGTITCDGESVDVRCPDGAGFVLLGDPYNKTYDLSMDLVLDPAEANIAFVFGHTADGFQQFNIRKKENRILVAHNHGKSEHGGLRHEGSQFTTERPDLGASLQLRIFVAHDRLAGIWVNGEPIDLIPKPGSEAAKLRCSGSYGFWVSQSGLKVTSARVNGAAVLFSKGELE